MNDTVSGEGMAVERTVPMQSPGPRAIRPAPPHGTEPARPATDDGELRSDEMWLFRVLPPRLVVPVILLAVVASLLAIAARAPWWGGVIAGVAVVFLGLAPVRGTPAGMRLAGWMVFRWRSSRRRSMEPEPPFDVPLPDGGSCGTYWDGTRLTTMLRIDPPPDTLTLLRRGSLSTDQVLPLSEIARCLEQFDIGLESVDVISTGTRTANNEAVLSGYAYTVAPLMGMYHEILGPLPAIAHRTVWIVLRLDPLANAQAVANRGGGGEGALRSAIIATRRVANRLAARGITASILTSAEMNGVMRQLTRGIPVEDYTELQNSLEHNGIHLVTYEIGEELIDADGLAQIWASPSLATTVTVRLRSAREPGTPAENRSAGVELEARVRYDMGAAPEAPPLPGLRELPRRQQWALLDGLPIGPRDTRPARSYRGPITALRGLMVPTAGCGQLIGADESGRGIAVPLIGDGSRRIDIVGSLHLAQQVILRAIALGAGVVVYTNRPGAWQRMVANVGAPHALSLASRTTGQRNVGMAPGAPHPAATVIVFDGVVASAPSGSATILTVHNGTTPPQLDADVTIIEHTATAHTVTVQTPATTTTARLVTTPTEQRYIGGALVDA
ncbi:type VII secretion protein EccE [Nocardia terpenica]|nr:type VII secretion protein EccE [Nocardia terpenica]